MHELDERDRELLTALQLDIPVASTPYALVGQQIDLSEKDVIKRIDRLKQRGAIKQISAFFDMRALGYRSCLVAAEASEDNIDRAASIVNLHPGVYQNYRRNHDLNLWFNIAVPPQTRIGLEKSVELVTEAAECRRVRMLPSLKSFKASADREVIGDDSSGDGIPPLSEQEIEVVRLLQRDLPLQPRPFEALGKIVGMGGDEMLHTAKSLRDRQQLRRIAAIPAPRRPAFQASAIGVWSVPADESEHVCRQVAAHRSVSQCNLRPTFADWPYNVFTIVHGRTVDECESVLSEISGETGIQDWRALFPIKEYKRIRLQYFAPEFERWESTQLDAAASAAV